ncbi:tetratricopeptide repeat protein [Streptomyces sp. b94]|uniref:tetratricopeptide repeat protein n=1 Tax=Streptomyces sp. b94 TaxID=1827634 RepID=UPI001B38F59D|nr:tetratricopeptide repeat protein [Streptomyces sp. b94]MBQ1094908.1 tetratricopeptide repeat protein [Streptomyces sp. b94]
MSRLGREKQRDHAGAERSPTPAATPIDVRVPVADSGARSASIDGSVVVAAPGEEIQDAVLNRLHRLALAAGHPVLATIHDERIGCSVPLRVDPDGSSHLAAEPVPTAPEEPAVRRDQHTHVLRTVEPVRDSTPTFRLPPVPESQQAPAGESAPTFTLRALPEPAEGTAPGTVAPPTGEFGPPPRMDGASATGARDGAAPQPAPGAVNGAGAGVAAGAGAGVAAGGAPGAVTGGAPGVAAGGAPGVAAGGAPGVAAGAGAASVAAPGPVTVPKPPLVPESVADLGPDPKPTPTPARGFDAVAEAVLGDEPLTAPGDATAPALLAEPTARINEAVKEGRTEAAAQLAEQTVAEASGTLGPEHPEVLRLRELTAYIAYLSGDPDRAFRLSLDLSRIHRRAGDAEAAYGNVQSAATAWRAVRDPARGLELGHELVGLWSELAAEEGPAAEDSEQLESARSRIGRLAERARAAGTG